MTEFVNKSLFLKSAQLSGYKSIVDVYVEFHKGLNIIIGKNAAGKTNFLKFLQKNISLEYSDLNNFVSELTFQNGKEITIRTEKLISVSESLEKPNFNSKFLSTLRIDENLIQDGNERETSLVEKLINNNIVFDCTFLCHGVPKDYFVIDKPISFKAEFKKIPDELFNIFSERNNPYFLRTILIDIAVSLFNLPSLEDNVVRDSLNKVFKEIEQLKEVLKLYSPISDIKFSEHFNIFYNEDAKSFTLNNLFMEFKIDDNWLPYSSLSDGTKRLFYIISEVYNNPLTNRIRPSSNDKYYSYSEISRIVLIEEPELGIHPHQFQKLMKFLKEESEKKQIIITTHSPQSLDSLLDKEFNRIIIAYSESSKGGTKLRHLNQDEIIKANEYIKEDFLSDYWLYSDLEK